MSHSKHISILNCIKNTPSNSTKFSLHFVSLLLYRLGTVTLMLHHSQLLLQLHARSQQITKTYNALNYTSVSVHNYIDHACHKWCNLEVVFYLTYFAYLASLK